MPLPDIPVSWTDLDMHWDDVHIAPHDPYYIALSEAIKERAAATDKLNEIADQLKNPTPLLEPVSYARDIELALDMLIPLYNNPATDEPWTEATILAAIGASERILYKYFFTADWCKQQYDIINKLLQYPYEDALGAVDGRKGIEFKSVSNTTWPDAVSDYNAQSWVSGYGFSYILGGFLTGGGPNRVIRSARNEILIRANPEDIIPIGSNVKVYVRYGAPSGYYFIPLDGKEAGVEYLEATIDSWNPDYEAMGALYENIGMIVSPPGTVTTAHFPTDYNAMNYENFRLNFQKPAPSFNFVE